MKIAIKYKRIFLFIFLLFIIGWIYTPGFLELRGYVVLLHQYKREIKELKEKNRELKRELWSLQNDPFVMEKLGREELGLVKKGEMLYKVR